MEKTEEPGDTAGAPFRLRAMSPGDVAENDFGLFTKEAIYDP